MSKPIVAIVGRPNVGKSTLFNKLAGTRISIVEDSPGVTRDRIYAESEWIGKKFTIIDTGGIEVNSEDVILKQMRLQAEVAIDTANVILFLVDGKEGITPADKEVAEMLRKSKKPIVLVVNKIDKLKDENNIYEFYNLGIGDPVSISSAQALGLGDMLDEIVNKFPDSDDDSIVDERIKIAFIGKPNVGKSSLINKILGEERNIVSDIPGTTRDSIDSYIDTEEGKFTLIDTAGLRKKSKIKGDIEKYSVIRTLASVERADVCILMIDAEDNISEQDEKIIGFAHDLGKAIFVIVNKWDLIEKDNSSVNEFTRKIRLNLAFMAYAPLIFISAKTGQRVNKVLTLAKKCFDNYSRRITTGTLNEVVNKATMMNEPPLVGTKRLRIFYVTQVAIKPPTYVFFVNDQDAIHFSYKRYLENKLRESFDFEGTGIKVIFREKERKDV